MLTSNASVRLPTKPLFTIQHSSLSSSDRSRTGNDVASVCYLSNSDSSSNIYNLRADIPDDSDSDDVDSSYAEMEFKCRTKLISSDAPQHVSTISHAATLSFKNALLAACHTNGKGYIFNLSTRDVAKELEGSSSGPGLAMGKIRKDSFYFQRRNENGSIEIHDLEKGVIQTLNCNSQTFCKAISVKGIEHILITPSKNESFAQLWDIRQKGPIGLVHGAGFDKDENRWLKEGMLMSLSGCTDDQTSLYLSCGMESGSLYVHDIRMLGNRDMFSVDENGIVPSHSCSINLGKDPILCVDTVPSKVSQDFNGISDRNHKSILIATGAAADASEQLDLPEKDRGTVTLVKASSRYENSSFKIKCRKRAKVGTCQITDDWSFGGKPGVNAIKFRPQGDIFGVGGWDKRVRIYSRSSAKLLAVFRGPNNDSITCLDWVDGQDELDNGILIAGSADGIISFWRAYSN